MSNGSNSYAGQQERPSAEEIYPPLLSNRERRAILERRRLAGLSGQQGAPETDVVGLALSGGGIRSATFALGVLQSLARVGLLKHIDYLSTVSGGGYIGAFLGRLYTRETSNESKREFRKGLGAREDASTSDIAESVLSDFSSNPVRYLKENGRYLSPNGAGDMLLGAAVILRNWASMRFFLMVWILMWWILAMGIRCGFDNWIGNAVPKAVTAESAPTFADQVSRVARGESVVLGIWWSPYVLLPVMTLMLWVIPAGASYWLLPFGPRNPLWRARWSFYRSRWDFDPLDVVVVLAFSGFIATRVPFWPPLWTTPPGLLNLALSWNAHFWSTIIILALIGVLWIVDRRRLGKSGVRSWMDVVSAFLLLFLSWLLLTHGSRYLSRMFDAMPDTDGWFALAAVSGVSFYTACRIVTGALSRSERISEDGTLPVVNTLAAVLAVATLGTIVVQVVLDLWQFIADSASAGRNRPQPWQIAVSVGVVIVGVTAAWALIAQFFARRWVRTDSSDAKSTDSLDVETSVRHFSSAILKWGLIVTVLTVSFATLDSIGQSLYALVEAEGVNGIRLVVGVIAGFIGTLAGIGMGAKKLVIWLTGGSGGERIKLRWEVLALGVAGLVVAIELVIVSGTAHAIAWAGQAPYSGPGHEVSRQLNAALGAEQGNHGEPTQLPKDRQPQQSASERVHSMNWKAVWGVFAVLATTAMLHGRIWSFVNDSTYQPLYSARLTRAYLGASNPARWSAAGRAVTRTMADDTAGLDEYRPHECGGPLHLINITINETVRGRSQITHLDRKGQSLSVGPCGVSVARRHHAVWKVGTGAEGVLEESRWLSRVLATLLVRLETDPCLSESEGIRLDSVLEAVDPDRNLAQWMHGELNRGQMVSGLHWAMAFSGSRRALERTDAMERRKRIRAAIDRLNTLEEDISDFDNSAASVLSLPLIPAYPAGYRGFRIFVTDEQGSQIDCEDLPVDLAMTISGAAFSTGLGYRTTLGMSLLCGLFNVRLGYWWDSGISARHREASREGIFQRVVYRVFGTWLFPSQLHVLQEFMATFHGPARRYWYLTDGGHYENMGALELIRRKVPWIIISDAEADPDFTFHGMSKLVRTARSDFGAEITFLDERELDSLLGQDTPVRRQFGAPGQLKRGRWEDEPVDDPNTLPKRPRINVEPKRERLSLAHAALAWVRYPKPDSPSAVSDVPGSLIICLKPTLNGDESEDIRNYHGDHSDFPQETTIDQFFDEAQWESYRKLGEHITAQVFGTVSDERAPTQWMKNASHRTPAGVHRQSIGRIRTTFPPDSWASSFGQRCVR